MIYQPRVWQSLDITWNFGVIVFAAQLEHFFAIVTASIPALTALFHHSKRKPLPSTQTTLTRNNSILTHSRTLSAQSQPIDTKPREFVSDCGVYEHHSDNALPLRLSQHSVLYSFNSNDFLTWAYDPECKNGKWGYGNYAIAYGEYTMNQSNKRGYCFNRFYHGWSRGDGSLVNSPRKACGVESNETLVDTPWVSGDRIGQGPMMDNQILMTSEVAVKHSKL